MKEVDNPSSEDYVFLQKLGSGSFGSVHKVREKSKLGHVHNRVLSRDGATFRDKGHQNSANDS